MLKMSQQSHSPIHSYDPARIDTVPQANLIMNLYGRLVDFSPDGQIIAGICQKFFWENDEIHFQMRPDHKTIDGWPITADDAAISLKRLIVKGNNTHGDLTEFLCHNHKLKSIHDDCPGIRVQANTLILKPSKPHLGKFLIPLLAGPDFGVIPKRAFRLESPNLEIIDYRNTSGAYYVLKDDPNGNILLQSNTSFPEYSEKMPQAIQLVPVAGDSSISKFRNGEIDFITTSDNASMNSLLALEKEVPGTQVHKTLDIKIWLFDFTKKGQARFSPAERVSVGKELRKVFLAQAKENNFTPTFEFFPKFGEGSLDPEQLERLKKVFSEAHPTQFNEKLTVGVPPSQLEKISKILINIDYIEAKAFSDPPWTLPENEQPDLIWHNTDGAFFEDISLLSYNIDAGTFGMTRAEGTQWLSDYMRLEDKAERLQRLRELHFKILAEGIVIPIGTAPYLAVARAPWKIHFSQLYAGSLLWQVRKE